LKISFFCSTPGFIKILKTSIFLLFFSDTTHDSGDGDYGIDDVRSDQDSDNDDEDETRIPGWAKGLYFLRRVETFFYMIIFFFLQNVYFKHFGKLKVIGIYHVEHLN
jgi:hypothetical protein